MEIHTRFDSHAPIKNPVLTIGTFDGVHLGHQKIIQRLNEEAAKIGGESVLFTFHPHPRMVIQPDDHGIKLLQTQDEKLAKLERMGLNHVLVYPFTREFSLTPAKEFIKNFLIDTIGVHTIVVGYDHHFGKNREGSLEQLQEMAAEGHFRVIEIPAHEIDEINVSSTKIRQALQDGDAETAHLYLNEAFQLQGPVIKGNQLGRTIGYPTANVLLNDPLKLIPKTGVYAVHAHRKDGRSYPAMMNIGYRPSVNHDGQLHCEVHLFDFNEDLYGENLSVSLNRYVRSEQKFASVDELKAQLAADEAAVRAILALH